MSDAEAFTLPGGGTIEMVRIEPGMFTMGSAESEEGRWSDEGPPHEVTINQGFYLGKYVVTQAQWAQVMGTYLWEKQDLVLENPDHPAVYVSWEDAQEFMGRLNEAEGTYRLPTEAEWEYVCRAGTTTRWSFGDDESQMGEYAWYRGNVWDVGAQFARSVGTKKPNPWGLYDMHGNVWEWVQDWHSAYPDEAQTDPAGPEKGTIRVLRGSGYSSLARAVRSAFRYGYTETRRFHCIGFRVLREG